MSRDELDPLEEESRPVIDSDAQNEAANNFETEVVESSNLDDVDQGDTEPAVLEESDGAQNVDLASSDALPLDEQAVLESYKNFDNQAAVARFFEIYREQQAAKRAAAGESEGADLLPADAPLRRKNGYFYAEPRRLPPPTAFEELVVSYSKPRTAKPTPEVEERWLTPDFLPEGSQSAGVSFAPAEGEIKVTVEVRLTSEARERITDQAIAKAAQTHQNHTEIVAKRLYELTREIRDREAARRVLHRR
jgi:hypothetical protein